MVERSSQKKYPAVGSKTSGEYCNRLLMSRKCVPEFIYEICNEKFCKKIPGYFLSSKIIFRQRSCFHFTSVWIHAAPFLNTVSGAGSGPPRFPFLANPSLLNLPILSAISAIYVHPVTGVKIAGNQGIMPSFSRLTPSKPAYYGRRTCPPGNSPS